MLKTTPELNAIKLICILAILAEASMSSVAAQQHDRMLQHYGQSPRHYTEPYTARGRDRQGNRVVVNGRFISTDSTSPEASSRAASFSGGVSTRRAYSTLRGSTLNSSSIGNNIQISQSWGGTYIINQRNNGRQTSYINGR